MGEQTKIEWTDSSWNPFIGCQPIAPGCANCYGKRWFKKDVRQRTSEANWRQPIIWNRKAACNCKRNRCDEDPHWPSCPQHHNNRRKVFLSLCDPFEKFDGAVVNAKGERLWNNEDVPRYLTLADCRRDLFQLIDQTPNLTWLLLTKRPENVRRMWPKWTLRGHDHPTEPRCFKNVWLGVSVSDQETADRNIPELLKLRDLTPCLFVSAEPLLGPIDLTGCIDPVGDEWVEHHYCGPSGGSPLDWVIVGGESGRKARPCHTAWVRNIVQRCQLGDVPVFVKQLGSHCLSHEEDDFASMTDTKISWRVNLQHPKGGDPAEWPSDLRVREMPR